MVNIPMSCLDKLKEESQCLVGVCFCGTSVAEIKDISIVISKCHAFPMQGRLEQPL